MMKLSNREVNKLLNLLMLAADVVALLLLLLLFVQLNGFAVLHYWLYVIEEVVIN